MLVCTICHDLCRAARVSVRDLYVSIQGVPHFHMPEFHMVILRIRCAYIPYKRARLIPGYTPYIRRLMHGVYALLCFVVVCCLSIYWYSSVLLHDDVIKWKHFPRYWPFVQGIHRWPVNSPHKGQWRGALMFSFIYAGINGWVNNREAGDLRRHRAHYDVIVMLCHRVIHTITPLLMKQAKNMGK